MAQVEPLFRCLLALELANIVDGLNVVPQETGTISDITIVSSLIYCFKDFCVMEEDVYTFLDIPMLLSL